MRARQVAERRHGAVEQRRARSPAAASPSSIIQPDRRVLRQRRLPLRRSTVPNAHEMAAPRMSSAPTGARWRLADVVAEQHAHAEHAEHEADDLAARQRLVQQRQANEHAPHRHRVGEDRAAARRQLLHAEQHEPVPAGDVEARERGDLAPPSRAESRIESPRKPATSEHADRRERQCQRAKGERRELGDAHLQHRPVAAPDQRQDGDRHEARARSGCRGMAAPPALIDVAASRTAARRTWLVQRARLRDPASRRMRPGNSGSFASNSSMSRSLQRAICR